jgi:hypothetical protein
LIEADELGTVLDCDVQRLKPAQQQALMDVLRQDQHEREGAEPRADVADGGTRRTATARPIVDRPELAPLSDDFLSDSQHGVIFEGARMDRERPRGGAGSRRPIDDAEPHALPMKAKRQHEPCGPGSNNQHVWHATAPASAEMLAPTAMNAPTLVDSALHQPIVVHQIFSQLSPIAYIKPHA